MVHVARCTINAFLRTASIRVGLAYSVQDAATILHTSPIESAAASAHGLIEAVKTARKSVVQSSNERVLSHYGTGNSAASRRTDRRPPQPEDAPADAFQQPQTLYSALSTAFRAFPHS
jgi:hypothetical protein